MIEDWSGFPVVMKMRENGEDESIQTYAINFNTNFKLDHQTQVAETRSFTDLQAISSEENYLLFSQNTGMTKQQSFILSNYVSKIHASINKNPEGTVSTKQLSEIIEQLQIFYSTAQRHQKFVNEYDENICVADLRLQLEEKINELVGLNQTYKQITRKAEFRSKLAGFGVSTALLA